MLFRPFKVHLNLISDRNMPKTSLFLNSFLRRPPRPPGGQGQIFFVVLLCASNYLSNGTSTSLLLQRGLELWSPIAPPLNPPIKLVVQHVDLCIIFQVCTLLTFCGGQFVRHEPKVRRKMYAHFYILQAQIHKDKIWSKKRMRGSMLSLCYTCPSLC